MPRLTPYPRGFALSPRPLNTHRLPPHFETQWIVDGWHFAHDPVRQPSLSVDDTTSSFVLVHGTCFAVGEETVDDVSAWLLEKWTRDRDEFLDALDVLAGRHVVVAGDPTRATIYQDAVGARSVYYSTGAEIVASHAHLVHDLVPHEPTPRDLLPGPATSTWDLSPWEGIRALVPNHSLTVDTWEVERFYPRRSNPYEAWTMDRRLTAVEQMWHRQLDAALHAFDDVAVSVTGGADSRVVLAMSRHHLPRFKGFTYIPGRTSKSQWSRMLSQDERIVGQLREFLPMDHEFFSHGDKSAPVSAELTALLDRNSFGRHGRWLVPHYNRFAPGDDVLHLRGNALEIARAYYGPRPDNDTVDAVRAKYAYKVGTTSGAHGTRTMNETQKLYCEEMLDHLGYRDQLWDYHRLDLFYWEHRCGRWLAEILNETDISFDTLMPVNIRAVLDILLSFDLDDRKQAYAYAELVNRNFPVLNFIGKNDDRNLYEQVRDAERADQPEKNGGTTSWLEAGMRILDADGACLEQSVQTQDCDLQLPLPHFRAGRAAVRRIVHEPVDGSLSFTFCSPYTSPQASGVFEYRLLVGGKVLAKVDGAAWDQESRITVHNLSAEDTVDLAVVALKSMSRQSWSTASRAHITGARFLPRTPEGPTRVASSNPHAHLLS